MEQITDTPQSLKGMTCFKGQASSYEDMRRQLKEAKLKFQMKTVICDLDENQKIKSDNISIHFIATREGSSNTLGIDLSGGRRAGKSIRQIDEAIRILFEEGSVEIKDHHELGTVKAANSILYKRVLKRIQLEHPNTSKHNLEAFESLDRFFITLKNKIC